MAGPVHSALADWAEGVSCWHGVPGIWDAVPVGLLFCVRPPLFAVEGEFPQTVGYIGVLPVVRATSFVLGGDAFLLAAGVHPICLSWHIQCCILVVPCSAVRLAACLHLCAGGRGPKAGVVVAGMSSLRMAMPCPHGLSDSQLRERVSPCVTCVSMGILGSVASFASLSASS